MWCPVCGDSLATDVAQDEARWLAHRLFRQEPEAVQAAAAILFSILAAYLVRQLLD